MEEVQQFLKECGVFYLATLDENQPRVRPFGVIEIFENHLYIQTGKSKNVSKQISKNPNVEICGYKDNRWIRITGVLIRDDRVEAKKNII